MTKPELCRAPPRLSVTAVSLPEGVCATADRARGTDLRLERRPWWRATSCNLWHFVAITVPVAIRPRARACGTRRALTSVMKPVAVSELRRPRAYSVLVFLGGLALLAGVAGCSSGSSSSGGPNGSAGASSAGSAGEGTGGSGASAGHGGTNVGVAGHDQGVAGASGASGTGGAGGAGGSVGMAGGGGKGGAGAGGAAGGSGGSAQAPACPATPPTAASSCASNGQECFYEDCAGAGLTAATCGNGSWAVQTGACAAVNCFGLPSPMSCAAGQVCSVSESGSIGAMCVESTCGSGPVTCECAHTTCVSCLIQGSVLQGVTVTCNNCPQGGCA
jgi:hypothetical protein